MAKTIAINGIRLDEVRLPMKPHTKGVLSSLSYPMQEIRITQEDRGLCLVVPAYLAVELYRAGILPQDANLPVEISIGGLPAGWYLVHDVRYPDSSDSPFGEVTLTLARVLQRDAGTAVEAPRQSAVVGGTYVTDIKHYLDEAGDIAPMPATARKLASFLTLLIEAATGTQSAHYHDSRIRCRTKGCRGTILTLLPASLDEISWHCPECGHNGVIRNWHTTKWNQIEPSGQPK